MTEQDKQNDLEDTKEFLRGYKNARNRLKRIEYKIQQIRLDKMHPSVITSDMPGAHNVTDLSDYAAKLDELEQMYIKERYACISEFQTITDAIESLADEKEKSVLFERYIKLKKWEDIAVELSISWRTLHRFHAKALRNIKMA